jgi:hypothetical protein
LRSLVTSPSGSPVHRAATSSHAAAAGPVSHSMSAKVAAMLALKISSGY